MQSAQQGDRVQVHYVIRLQDGSTASSRGRPPLELTVGQDHRRLPGLGSALIGLAPGARTRVRVPPEQAFGLPDPTRVRALPRACFAKSSVLTTGKLVRITDKRDRRRLVRVLRADVAEVVVDTNHRFAGQTVDLEVELVLIHPPVAQSPK